MNYLTHEYLVPVIIGTTEESLTASKIIFNYSGIKPHLFAEHFNIRQKWNCICHKVTPMREFLLKESLCHFSDLLDEYYFPVLIPCGTDAEKFVQIHSEDLTCHFVIIEYNRILKLKGENAL